MIALQGYVFSKNFGDVLLRVMFERWLREAGADTVVLPVVPDHLRAEYVADYYGLNSMKKASAIVLYGGGYLGASSVDEVSWNDTAMSRYGEVMKAALDRNLPIAVLGVGVGPLPKGSFSDLLGRVFDVAKVVVVRDSASFEAARAISTNPAIETLSDAAFALRSQIPMPAKQDRVALHLTGKFAETEIVHAFAEGIERSTIGYPVSIVRDDKKVWTLKDRVKSLLGREVDRDWMRVKSVFSTRDTSIGEMAYQDVEQFVRELASSRFVITTKLHVGLVALTYGVPVLALPVHQKTVRMYSFLGIADCLLPATGLTAEVIADRINYVSAMDFDALISPYRERAGLYPHRTADFIKSLQSTPPTN